MQSSSRRATVHQSPTNNESLSILDLQNDSPINSEGEKRILRHQSLQNHHLTMQQSMTSSNDESIILNDNEDDNSGKSHISSLSSASIGSNTSCLLILNEEREKLGLKPLTRDPALDAQARKYAKLVADSAGRHVLKITDYHGGHVLRGLSVKSIHKAVLNRESHHAKSNVMNPQFHTMGLGIAHDKENGGKIYLCEIFKGDIELTCMDME